MYTKHKTVEKTHDKQTKCKKCKTKTYQTCKTKQSTHTNNKHVTKTIKQTNTIKM